MSLEGLWIKWAEPQGAVGVEGDGFGPVGEGVYEGRGVAWWSRSLACSFVSGRGWSAAAHLAECANGASQHGRMTENKDDWREKAAFWPAVTRATGAGSAMA